MCSVFVGASRVKLVERLSGSFAETCADGRPQAWVLSAPSGWGKTRVVQELYARLAAESQGAAAYWPPAIVDADRPPFATARKTLQPAVPEVTVPHGPLPWMWWGINCFRLNDGSLGRALDEGADQLYIHAEALIAAERSLAEETGEAFDVSSATIGILALFVGVLAGPAVAAPIAGVSAVREVVKGTKRVRDLIRRRRQRQEGPVQAAGRFDESVIQRLVELMTRLGRAVPIVLIIDDAHDADQTTVDVLARMLASARLRLFVVALAWPGELDIPASRPFAAWIESAHSNVQRVDLPPLERPDLRELIGSLAPATEPTVLDAFAGRYDNPLALRAAVELPRVQRLTAEGRINMAASDVASIPATVEGVFTEAWRALPNDVGDALASASLFGPRFIAEFVTAAADRAGFGLSASALSRAVEPFRWIRGAQRSVSAFVDHAFYAVAADRVPEVIAPTEVQAIREEFAACLHEPDMVRRIASRAWIEAVGWHVAMVQEGMVTAGDAAVRSAVGLAIARNREGDLEQGAALLDQADEWATTPAQRLSVLTQRAWMVAFRGDYQQAVDLLERALATADVAPTDREWLHAENDRGFWISQMGERERAMSIFAGVLTRARKALGATDGLTFTIRRNHAHELGLTGHYLEAKEASEQLLRELIELDGPINEAVLIERSYLASWTEHLDGPMEAAALFRELVPVMAEEIGPLLGPTITARRHLADNLMASGQIDEAHAVWQALLADLQAAGEGSSPHADDARRWIAWLSRQTGGPPNL